MENNTDRELLAAYAPVLRFSGGENFLPMNVEDFVGGNTRLYRRVKGKRRMAAVTEWDAETDPRKRLQMLGTIKEEDAYLRYLNPESASLIRRGILMLEIGLLIALAIFSIFGLSSMYPLVNLDFADTVKLGVLGLLLVIWPFIDADGKAHLGLVLCLFGIFFFGTTFTIGFAGLALGQLLGFWVVYGVFRSLFQTFMKRSRKWTGPLLHGLSLLLIAVSNVLVGFLLDWIGRGRGWLSGSHYELPVIIMTSTILFYSLMITSNAYQEKLPPDSLRPKEIATGFLLLFVLLACVAILWSGLQLNWISAPAAYLAAIFLFGATLLWYLLDPISVTRPGLLGEDNWRKAVFGWDGRVLFIITVTLVVYLGTSALVLLHRYNDINDFLFAAIIHFAISASIILTTLGILGDRIPGYLLDVLSGLYNIDALLARKKYREAVASRLRREDPQASHRFWYYGRVVREGEWTVLQYNYFYAYNDFRSTAGGVNNHEGDWECVHIYLSGDVSSHAYPGAGEVHLRPFGVAYSQHYHGMFEFWEDVLKAKDGAGYATRHPLVYAALGSHANYSKPEIYPLSMQFTSTTQGLVNWLEEFIQGFRTRSHMVEKHIREVENAFVYYEKNDKGGLIAQGDKTEGGAREFAGGDGIRVGFGFDLKRRAYEGEFKIVLAPPPAIQRRESNFDGMPASKNDIFEDWAFELIDEDTDWTKFTGLWGRKSRVEGESGPQGPRWAAGRNIRIRWGGRKSGYYLEWLDTLLLDIIQDDTKPVEIRKKALQFLSKQRDAFVDEDLRSE